ncbi:UNKNOWN [Stylonychia lemnae]|uniref:Uncharacterized protein n=1 Tax=Stylonychia lemnae TaxID=5949 RepID=A0A077ZRG9_STYLE|nr:UNKNOWN [Stylonychia lemnae]|eukprot:CDW72054.1 UNKNOWN [Stylonychia lemnae]
MISTSTYNQDQLTIRISTPIIPDKALKNNSQDSIIPKRLNMEQLEDGNKYRSSQSLLVPIVKHDYELGLSEEEKKMKKSIGKKNFQLGFPKQLGLKQIYKARKQSIFQFEQNDKRKVMHDNLQNQQLLYYQQIDLQELNKNRPLVIDPNTGSLVQKQIYKQKNPNLFGMKFLNSKIQMHEKIQELVKVGTGVTQTPKKQKRDNSINPTATNGFSDINGNNNEIIKTMMTTTYSNHSIDFNNSLESPKKIDSKKYFSSFIDQQKHKRNIVLTSTLTSQSLTQYSQVKQELSPKILDLAAAQKVLTLQRKHIQSQSTLNQNIDNILKDSPQKSTINQQQLYQTLNQKQLQLELRQSFSKSQQSMNLDFQTQFQTIQPNQSKSILTQNQLQMPPKYQDYQQNIVKVGSFLYQQSPQGGFLMNRQVGDLKINFNNSLKKFKRNASTAQLSGTHIGIQKSLPKLANKNNIMNEIAHLKIKSNPQKYVLKRNQFSQNLIPSSNLI